jgi:formylglycine-generating enzyme required for sulfatase activity
MADNHLPFALIDRIDPTTHRSEQYKTLLERRQLPHFSSNHQQAALYYKPSRDLLLAINMALHTGSPLLLTGEPGTGKTQAATFVGTYFGIKVYPFVVKSTSVAQDLLYEFDAVGYLHWAQAARETQPGKQLQEPEAIQAATQAVRQGFLHERALWQAYDDPQDSVVLIDEIDKAPRDFPNDLLHELDQHSFPPSRSLAELGDFLTVLRVHGIPVGPEDIDRLRQLFALQPDLDRQGLQSLLSALLVKTPEHRQTFAALFDDWCPDHDADWQPELVSVPEAEHTPDREPPSPLAPPATDDPIVPQPSRLIGSIWMLLGGIALLGLLSWVLWSQQPVVIQPPVEKPEVAVHLPDPPTPAPDELPADPVPHVWFWKVEIHAFTVPRRLKPLELAVLGVIPIGVALLVGIRYRRRFREIRPLPPAQGHGWQPLPAPERDDTALMDAIERRQLVWQIEHFLSDDPTRRLHLQRTVEATARAGGFVHMHFQSAVYDRTIWFWLDRQMERSIPRLVVQQLMAILRAAGLEAQQGLFTDAPDRIDWPAQAGYMPEHEEGHGRQAVVAIFIHGEGLAQRLAHPLTRFATERLLRDFQHWPRLCFVDCSADGASLRALLEPYRLTTIALAEVPAWLGGVTGWEQVGGGQALYGDERAWAGAVALGGLRVESESAHTLRVVLGLQASSWQVERILEELQDPGACKRHINWLLRCDPPGEDGLPPVSGLARRALDWWQRRYREATERMQAQENPLLPWRHSLASRRWQVEQAVLQLYYNPVGAAETLAGLASADLQEEIHARLSEFAALEHAESNRNDSQVIYLPWRLDMLPVMTRNRLRRLGFADRVYQQKAMPLPPSPRLVLAVTMLGMLALIAWGTAFYRWRWPEVPRLLVDNTVYEHPAFAAQTIDLKEPLATGDYQVTLGSARHTVTVPQPVPAGALIPVSWQWQEEPNAIALQGSTILRAGRLAQPIRACSPGWPQRSLVVIAAPDKQKEARQLAIRLLDKGSADQVLLGENWENALPEWLGSSPSLNHHTQVLVVVLKDSDAEAAVVRLTRQPDLGTWAVVISEDMAGVARKIDFASSLAIRQVGAPWRVHRSQGEVFVYGGPQRMKAFEIPEVEKVLEEGFVYGGPQWMKESGIEWVHVCPGTFTMGRRPGEDIIVENEKDENWQQIYQLESVEPQRTVVLSAFHIAATETTQQQYGETGALPQVDIHWSDARTFCQSAKINGDLPTEAQWEYAARGGSRFPWSFGDDVAQMPNYAWFVDNSENQLHEVGKKEPNPLGLYDMHGNAWEWVRDWYGDYEGGVFVDPADPKAGPCWEYSSDRKFQRSASVSCRVVRGGSFNGSPVDLRSADRVDGDPEDRDWDGGFRCVRVPPSP